MFKVVTFYKFIHLNDLVILKKKLQLICEKSLTGTLLIASEGINGTISGLPDSLNEAINKIKNIPSFSNLYCQYSQSNYKPFKKLKIKIKKEIITMRQTKLLLKQEIRGCHVLAKNWNDRLSDKETIIIDVRNNYEYRLGSFQGSINPNISYFSQFTDFIKNDLKPYKNHPIAMFCTGGIRCEKASAYMLANGFTNLYQLSGGILQYLAYIKEYNSKWQGECFVFDNRISIIHGLKKGSALLCYGCRIPLTKKDLDENYKPGVKCKFCSNKK